MKDLARHLDWRPAEAKKESGRIPAGGRRESLDFDVYQTARDRAVYLLKIAAEVEHSLMVQYLFAAWSLGGRLVTKPDQIKLVSAWRSVILEIAREEMGHLATVQNLLTLIGGSLSFAREDYPTHVGDLFPFEFQLERLSKRSLAKYVLSEMPSDAVLKKLQLVDKIRQIRREVGASGPEIHRVGKLYDEIKRLFTAPDPFRGQNARPDLFIAQSDIQSDAVRWMVRPGEWSLGNQNILIHAPSSRQDALDAIAAIADQGEGSDITNFPRSHFARFLEIYDHFPPPGWVPTRNLAENPTTDQNGQKGSVIKNSTALLWAKLLNLRYKMLLMFLSHSFAIAAPADSRKKSPRGLLISWAFGEMYHLRSIAEFLMSLPLGRKRSVLAGPPFEMPTSLGLPYSEANRWRLHRDSMFETEHYAAKLLELRSMTEAQKKYLLGLRHTNSLAIQQAIKMVGS